MDRNEDRTDDPLAGAPYPAGRGSTRVRPGAARTAVRAAVAAVALASGAALLVACGSSGSKSASSAGSSASAKSAASGAAGMDAYRQCLQQHGVTLPSGRPGGGGFGGGHPSGRPSSWPTARPSGSARAGRGGWGGFGGYAGASADPKTQQAMKACASERPSFGGGASGGTGGFDSSAFKAFQSCLKDHGVAVASASPGAYNTSNPKYAKAFKVCGVLLPQRGGGGGSASASPAS
jgi:hypothetical protein